MSSTTSSSTFKSSTGSHEASNFDKKVIPGSHYSKSLAEYFGYVIVVVALKQQHKHKDINFFSETGTDT